MGVEVGVVLPEDVAEGLIAGALAYDVMSRLKGRIRGFVCARAPGGFCRDEALVVLAGVTVTGNGLNDSAEEFAGCVFEDLVGSDRRGDNIRQCETAGLWGVFCPLFSPQQLGPHSSAVFEVGVGRVLRHRRELRALLRKGVRHLVSDNSVVARGPTGCYVERRVPVEQLYSCGRGAGTSDLGGWTGRRRTEALRRNQRRRLPQCGVCPGRRPRPSSWRARARKVPRHRLWPWALARPRARRPFSPCGNPPYRNLFVSCLHRDASGTHRSRSGGWRGWISRRVAGG